MGQLEHQQLQVPTRQAYLHQGPQKEAVLRLIDGPSWVIDGRVWDVYLFSG